MKRVGSFLIAFMMCAMLGVPAFAAEPQEAVAMTKVADGLLNGEYVMSIEGEENSEVIAAPAAEETEVSAMAGVVSDLIRPSAAPVSVEVYPVIVVPEDNGAAYTLNDLRRYKELSGKAQSEFFNLSPTATTTYLSEIQSVMQAYSNQTGKSCSFIGWQVTCKFTQTATRPQYITMTPTSSSLTGTDEVKQTIPSNYTTSTYTITGIFAPYYELDQMQWFGFNGAFYYKTETGKIVGMMLTSGFGINK